MFKSRSRDSDSDRILTDNEATIETEMLNSTCLKIQTEKGEIQELTVSEERRRDRTLARLVDKNGQKRVRTVSSARLEAMKMRDLFTWLVELNWVVVLLVTSLTYLACWLSFALVWYGLAAYHGDLSQSWERNRTACVEGVDDIISSVLFSVELQQTIGYGSRVPSAECSSALLLQSVQTILGMLVDAAVVGVVFTKIARPGRRALTVVFSKNAVITQRNGALHLIFQVADIQLSQLVESHFRAQLRSRLVTEEGEVLHNYMRELRLTTQCEGNSLLEDRGLLLLPVQVSHVITEDSPLYSLDPITLLNTDLEIILVMEAVVEPSGNTTQALTSYLPDEILWGCTFQSTTDYDRTMRSFNVDIKKMNSVSKESYTPWTSARDIMSA